MDSYPRLVRPVPTPAALYLRPNRNDHRVLESFLAEDPALSGLVLDPLLSDRHHDLRVEARRRSVEAILDPRTVEMATPEGFTQRLASLPWAGERHSPSALEGQRGVETVKRLAEYAVEHHYSAILAPTHYIKSTADAWFAVDLELTRFLRRFLDLLGRPDTPIYYPLVVNASSLRDPSSWDKLVQLLITVPIDGLWLRVHPFGTNDSGPIKLQGYIRACWSLQRLSLPIVATYTGTVGLPLIAFGAVGGIESGITLGERFEMNKWIRPRKKGKAFLAPPRVYIPQLGVFLNKKQAVSFFQNRQMKAKFGCRGHACCRRGSSDMLENPKHHFLVRRQAEVSKLSRVPLILRPQHYLEEFLRPATDLALRAVKVEPSLESKRKRLESWRVALGSLQSQKLPERAPIIPRGQRVKERRGA